MRWREELCKTLSGQHVVGVHDRLTAELAQFLDWDTLACHLRAEALQQGGVVEISEDVLILTTKVVAIVGMAPETNS